MVDVPTSPIADANTNTFQINALAAQHASNSGWMVNTPASWLAWITSTPALADSPIARRIEGGDRGSEVMNLESDEEEVLTEDYGQTPTMTPDAVVGSYEGQKGGIGGWGWAARARLSGEGRASTDSSEEGKDNGKGKRPSIGVQTLSVDSVVPPLPESDGEDGEFSFWIGYFLDWVFVSFAPSSSPLCTTWIPHCLGHSAGHPWMIRTPGSDTLRLNGLFK
jgi:hypothetical protein